MKSFVALTLLVLSTAQAATIAVIDSGMDRQHEALVNNHWVNPSPSIWGAYPRAYFGWNFAENNNQIIDYGLLEYFSPDIKTFYDLQAKAKLYGVTQEEVDWFNSKIEDKKFLSDAGVFANYVHGTHVAGIAVKNSQNIAMGIKFIATNVKSVLNRFKENTKSNSASLEKDIREAAAYVAFQSSFKMKAIGQFIHAHKAEVANGSFGVSYDITLGIADALYQELAKKAPSPEKQHEISKLILQELIKEDRKFVNAAPKTLFVFSAGNDGSNNDIYGSSPANVNAENTITVAATYKDKFLASFSNYGVKTVDVAAPGMLINSSIPGNEYMIVSGTSQAAPYVANIAGQVKDANPELSPADIKKIIMETVDKKSFLLQKVKSGGIVNTERAVFAAELSRNISIKDAIDTARRTMPNLKSNFQEKVGPIDVTPIQMPSPLEL